MTKERSVTWDQLKEMYPNDDENELMEAAKSEGIDVPDNELQEKEQDESTGESGQKEEVEVAKETAVEVETDEEEKLDERTKKGLITAKQKERDKRKAVEAELAAIKAELEQMRKAPVQQAPAPAPAPVQQQQQEQVDIYGQIKNYAKQQAIKKLGIEGNPQDLMFTDPEKYEDYVTERTKVEYAETYRYDKQQRIYQDNVNFVNELRSIPNFPVVYQFAEKELDELPRREARKIDDAFMRINQGQGSQTDFTVVRDFAKQCQEKLNKINAAPAPQQGANLLSQTGGKPDKLDQLSAGTRTGQLRTGTASNMTEAELIRLLDDPENLSQVPASVLNKYKRGF